MPLICKLDIRVSKICNGVTNMSHASNIDCECELNITVLLTRLDFVKYSVLKLLLYKAVVVKFKTS